MAMHRIRSVLAQFLALPLAAASLGGMEPPAAASRKPAKPQSTSYVSCWGDATQPDGLPYASRHARGDLLISPNGRYRAYAEVEARPASQNSLTSCANTSKLYSADARGAFKLIYLEEPTRWQLGNGIKLVDWSPDSRYLLAEVTVWQYYSDVAGSGVLLYDTGTGTFSIPDHNQLFSKHFGKECFMEIVVQGFSLDRNIILEASRIDELIDGPACTQEKGLWLLNLSDPNHSGLESIKLLPKTYQVQRYGRWESHPAKK